MRVLLNLRGVCQPNMPFIGGIVRSLPTRRWNSGSKPKLPGANKKRSKPPTNFLSTSFFSNTGCRPRACREPLPLQAIQSSVNKKGGLVTQPAPAKSLYQSIQPYLERLSSAIAFSSFDTSSPTCAPFAVLSAWQASFPDCIKSMAFCSRMLAALPVISL